MDSATTLLVLVLSTIISESGNSEKAPKPDLVVMDVRVADGSKPETNRLLSDYLLAAAKKLSKTRILGEQALKVIHKRESTPSGIDCETADCIKELADTLDAKRVLLSSVTKLGDGFIISCKLFDGSTGQMLRRWAKHSKNEKLELIGVMNAGVVALLGESAVNPPLSYEAAEDSSDSSPGVAPWVTGVAALASAATGIYLGNSAKNELGVSPSHPSYASTLAGAEQKVLGANLSFGVAGAAALLTGLLIVF